MIWLVCEYLQNASVWFCVPPWVCFVFINSFDEIHLVQYLHHKGNRFKDFLCYLTSFSFRKFLRIWRASFVGETNERVKQRDTVIKEKHLMKFLADWWLFFWIKILIHLAIIQINCISWSKWWRAWNIVPINLTAMSEIAAFSCYVKIDLLSGYNTKWTWRN